MTETEKILFDESLISKVANNDMEALRIIYDLTRVTVFSIALSITKNKENAEDVLHDTYIKIHEKASTYSNMGKPIAWICTIAKNLSLMKLRQKKKLFEFNYHNSVNYSYISKDDKLILESAFKVLNEKELQIVLLYSSKGYKHQEIADILDLPLATVLSNYHRSLKKMQKFLEGGI